MYVDGKYSYYSDYNGESHKLGTFNIKDHEITYDDDDSREMISDHLPEGHMNATIAARIMRLLSKHSHTHIELEETFPE